MLTYLRSRLLFLGAWGILLISFRLAMLHGQQPIFNPTEMPGTFADSVLTRILTLNYLVVFNAQLLAIPMRLSMDWSHGSIPLVVSLADIRVWETALFYLSMAWLLGVKIVRPLFTSESLSSYPTTSTPTSSTSTVISKSASTSHLSSIIDWFWLSMGLSLIVFPYLPGSNLFFTVGYVVAERTLYLPSMGFAILFGGGVQWLFRRFSHSPLTKISILLVVGLYICFLTGKSYVRNQQWQTNYR